MRCSLRGDRWKGNQGIMVDAGIDRLARALSRSRSRRQALLAVLMVTATERVLPALTVRGDTNDILKKKRKRAERRGEQRKQGRKKNKDGKEKKVAFPSSCKRFVLTAGPNRNDKFQHIDDDVLIELIPSDGGRSTVLLKDDNDEPNGNSGLHLSVAPFTAKVGDKIHVVARNEEVVGCELDEIWLWCIEGKGGNIKLADAYTPEDCRANANQVGIFLDETYRIRNS